MSPAKRARRGGQRSYGLADLRGHDGAPSHGPGRAGEEEGEVKGEEEPRSGKKARLAEPLVYPRGKCLHELTQASRRP
jgi:hypothetical protein